METNSDSPLIPVRTSGETLTMSSIDVADGLGIHHKNLLATIRFHQQAIENDFGLIAFETRKIDSLSGKGRPENIAHLNEDQALFIGTLSRNSKRVVTFKAKLVKSFSEARRRLSKGAQQLSMANRVLTDHDQRIADLEQKLALMFDSRQQAARSFLEAARSSEPLPEETTRAKIQRLVNGYCRANNMGQQDIWRRVYDRLYYLYKVSIRSYKRSERESWLDVAERNGHLEKIYVIVSAELIYTET